MKNPISPNFGIYSQFFSLGLVDLWSTGSDRGGSDRVIGGWWLMGDRGNSKQQTARSQQLAAVQQTAHSRAQHSTPASCLKSQILLILFEIELVKHHQPHRWRLLEVEHSSKIVEALRFINTQKGCLLPGHLSVRKAGIYFHLWANPSSKLEAACNTDERYITAEIKSDSATS